MLTRVLVSKLMMILTHPCAFSFVSVHSKRKCLDTYVQLYGTGDSQSPSKTCYKNAEYICTLLRMKARDWLHTVIDIKLMIQMLQRHLEDLSAFHKSDHYLFSSPEYDTCCDFTHLHEVDVFGKFFDAIIGRGCPDGSN